MQGGSLVRPPESRGIRKRAQPPAIRSRLRHWGDRGYRRPARRMLLQGTEFGADGGGERGQSTGRWKVGLTGGSGSDTLDPHKGLTYLDTARAQSLYQPLLQPEHPCTDGIRAGRGDQPARLDVQLGHPAPAGHHLPRRPAAHRRRRHHVQADHQREADRRQITRADRRERTQELRQPHRSGADSPYGSFLDQLAYWYYLYIVPTGFDPATRTEPARSNTSPSHRASAVCSSRTRTTGSRAFPMSTR